MKDKIRAILEEWLQTKDSIVFTHGIEAVTEAIYGMMPFTQMDNLLEENKRLKAIIDNHNPFPDRPNPRDVNPYDSKAVKRTCKH